MNFELPIRLTPHAGRDAVGGFEGGVLRVRVAAPPEDGRANEALIRLLAKALRVSRSAVSIRSGARSRNKVLEIEGLSTDEALRRLGAHE